MGSFLRLFIHPSKNVFNRTTESLFTRQITQSFRRFHSFETAVNSVRHNTTKGSNLTGLQRVNFCTRAYDINTNITKDVVLYKYENPKFFKILNIFGICQFIFWSYLSHFAFTTLRDAPVEKQEDELRWFERINLGENKYRNGITIMSFIIGN